MNAKVFILTFIVGLPIFIAVDYGGMYIHLIDARSFGSEMIGALFSSLVLAAVMTYFSYRRRKKQATNQ